MVLLTSLVSTVANRPPGVIIDYLAAPSRTYVGSPSIAILPDGTYVASHDTFGPRMGKEGATFLFRSVDRGRTWTPLPKVDPVAWSGLFVHRGALYLMGTARGYGQFVIRRSTDGGATWTPPSAIREDRGYHTAPTAVLVANGRIWRALERRPSGGGWASRFEAGMLSAPERADLLDPKSWTRSNVIMSDPKWNDGDMHGWLEGNAVAAPDGGVVDMLRVDVRKLPEKAALVRISPDGRTATFDPATGFVDFPGGSKKFTVRYDAKSRLYWSLASIIAPKDAGRPPSLVRNTLALTSSPDLIRWTVRRTVLHSPNVRGEAFQYADWAFDGDDLIAAVRTAFGGAHKAHDANYLTFHRIAGFRAGIGLPSPSG